MRYLDVAIKAFWGSVIIAVVVYCILTSIHTDTNAQTDTVVPTQTPIPVPSCVEAEPTPTLAPTLNSDPTPMPEPEMDEADLTVLAKVTYGEAGCCSKTEQAAVIWCILNRVEDNQFPDTIQEVVTQPGHFVGYDPGHPIYPELVELARDVLIRWESGGGGRVLPKEYVFFHGDGKANHFRTTFEHTGDYWDWSLLSPYEE